MDKLSAQAALVRLDLATVINKMNMYASMRLKTMSTKQLEGKLPEDFTADVILKVLDGTLNWLNASTNDMEAFLMMGIKGECSNFIKKVSRRNINLFYLKDNDEDYENT